jgi:hypothetical protein
MTFELIKNDIGELTIAQLKSLPLADQILLRALVLRETVDIETFRDELTEKLQYLSFLEATITTVSAWTKKEQGFRYYCRHGRFPDED